MFKNADQLLLINLSSLFHGAFVESLQPPAGRLHHLLMPLFSGYGHFVPVRPRSVREKHRNEFTFCKFLNNVHLVAATIWKLQLFLLVPGIYETRLGGRRSL